MSESEKHGVSTSSRRLSNKVENIPIKKRRFLLRSPSPPMVDSVDHTASQGVSEKDANSDVILSRVVDDNDSLDSKKSDKLDERVGQDEDFCGISILAAAACSYEDGQGCNISVKDESSVLEQVHESSTITEVMNSSKGLSKEDVMNSSEMSSGVTSSCKSIELASISTVVTSQTDPTVGNILKVDSSTISDDDSYSKNELAKNSSLSSRDERLHWDLNVVMDAWEQPFEELDVRNDVSHNISDDHGKVDYCKENHNDALTCHNEKSHYIDGVNIEHVREESVNHIDGLALTFNSNLDFDFMKSTIENTTDKFPEESVNHTIEAESTSLKSLNLKGFRPNVVIPPYDLQNLDNPTTTRISLCVSSNSGTMIDQKSNIGKSTDVEAPKILHHEGFNMVKNVDLKMFELREHSEFVICEDHGHPKRDTLDSMPKRSCELQEGCDSQYEDGELREPSFRAWEENDRETENIDNVSKYKGELNVDPNDYQVSDTSQEVDKNSEVYVRAFESVDKDTGRDEGHRIKSSHVVEKTDPLSGKEPIEDNKGFRDMETRSGDDNERKGKIRSSDIERSLDSRSTESRMEPRVFKRTLQSQVEGPVGRGDTSRDEQIKKMDDRFECGSMRSFERKQYSFQNQVRGRQGGSWDGSSNGHRGYRRHYSPINRGKRMIDNEGVGDRDDIRYVDSKLLSKNRGGIEVDSCTRFDPRFKSDRKFSPNRGGRGFGRGRSFMHGPFGEIRGGRGRCNGPSSDEAFQSSLIYRRPLSRRERSLSPFGVRGQSNVIHHSRRKSSSRSRSRSPIIWRRLGDGNGGVNTFLRHRSRSPNFRPETRIQRPRSPHQPLGFGVEHAGGLRPISRNHGSPRRLNYMRKDEMGQFKELGYKQRSPVLDRSRSPGRIPLRGDRGSGIDSLRNPKNDGYFRMTDRISDDVNRGVRYDDNYDDRRKQYSLIRPTRRHYDDDIDDSLTISKSFRDRDASNFQERELRGFDNCLNDVPRRFRGENSSFIYERDGGKFNNNNNNNNSSHNLKSDDQYQPKYVARLSRYENYENRRKNYGTTHIIRRTDNEDTEKRLNDNETFEDGRIGNLSTRFREDEEPIVCGGPSEN